jgi:hypothetical protein
LVNHEEIAPKLSTPKLLMKNRFVFSFKNGWLGKRVIAAAPLSVIKFSKVYLNIDSTSPSRVAFVPSWRLTQGLGQQHSTIHFSLSPDL